MHLVHGLNISEFDAIVYLFCPKREAAEEERKKEQNR